MTRPKLRALGDLKQLKSQLEAQTQALKLAQARAAELAREQEKAKNLFRDTVGEVKPLPQKTAVTSSAPAKPTPHARQRELDEQAVLGEALSDEFDVTTLLETDDELSYRQAGVAADVLRKLRRGEWSIQAQVDLHGLRRDEARDVLASFLRDAHKQGLRCVRVVHGKGLGSLNKEPVLKGKVRAWLVQRKEVIAFCQAKPVHGGAGALVVLLAPVHS
jgi:DNA-nicking Smr family endonuclease